MHVTCFKLSVQGCKHVLTETLVRASKSSLKTQSCSEDLRKIQTELRNAHFVRTLELFSQNAPSKMCVRVPNKFLLLFSSLVALKEKCWQNMVKNDATYLSTLSQLSSIQKKFDQQKRNSEFLSFKPKKTLLLSGSHYIILSEKNNANEKVSTAITKTRKYENVCFHGKKI